MGDMIYAYKAQKKCFELYIVGSENYQIENMICTYKARKAGVRPAMYARRTKDPVNNMICTCRAGKAVL